jgi:hypothetical protein
MPGLRTMPAVHQLRKALYWFAAPLAGLFVAAGCVAASAAGAPSASPPVLASPVASPSPMPSAKATTAAVATGSAAATPALPPATIDVSPPPAQVGSVTLSLTLEPARHMLAQTAPTATPAPSPTPLPFGAGPLRADGAHSRSRCPAPDVAQRYVPPRWREQLMGRFDTEGSEVLSSWIHSK